MRTHPLWLTLCVCLGFATPASAFSFERTLQPQVDLTNYHEVAIAPVQTAGHVWIDAAGLARSLASDISAAGFVHATALPQHTIAAGFDLKRPGALGELGTAKAAIFSTIQGDSWVDYGTTPVQKEYTVWREITDEHGRQRRVQEREWRTVYLRTERRWVRLIWEARAVETATGQVLGIASVNTTVQDYWQEDQGWSGPPAPHRLAQRGLDELRSKMAEAFSPQVVEVRREWRPKSNPDALTREGIKAAEEGRFQDAIDLFQQAIDADPAGAADRWGNIAIVYEALNEPDKALDAIRQGQAHSRGGHDLAQYAEEVRRTWDPAAAPVPTPAPIAAPTPVAPPRQPRVVKLDGTRMFIDAGTIDGWGVGDAVQLTLTEVIRNLEGEVLGELSEPVAMAEVVEVFERFAIVELASDAGEGLLRVGLNATRMPADSWAPGDRAPEDNA